MSRQLSRSSAAQAALAAVLVIGVMLLLIVSGHNDDVRDKDATGERGSSVIGGQELAGGFTTIPPDEFFATVTAAQKEAGGWHVALSVDEDGQSIAVSGQDVSIEEGAPAMRAVMQSQQGSVVAVYVDDQFYVRGLTRGPKPWWRAPASPQFESMLSFADPERFLAGLKDPKTFEVVGVEKVDVSDASGKDAKVDAVHYLIEVDAAVYDEQGLEVGTQPVEMDLWADAHDRPVQAQSTYTIDGVTTTTTLVYSAYGQIEAITAPPADEVTTKAPQSALR